MKSKRAVAASKMDAEIKSLTALVDRLTAELASETKWCATYFAEKIKLQEECSRLASERDDARDAARWLHDNTGGFREATLRWPWLEDET